MTDNMVGITKADDINAGSGIYADQEYLSYLIREVLISAGFGILDVSAPFTDIIKSGMTVLLKPNWVLHENLSGQGMNCLVTHPNFILALLKEVCKAKPGKVIIGDSPIQGCDFVRLVTKEFREDVARIATCPFEIIDFRRTIMRKGGFAEGQDQEARCENRYILFDLGKDSLLEPVSFPSGKFRITCYNPDILAERHCPGRHQYMLCKEPFEADVVINIPKLKTHKKAGMTAALKNLVGLNGNKEYLPHHRVGGNEVGGDCYSGFAPIKRLVEYSLDEANRRIGKEDYSKWISRAYRFLNWHGIFGNKEIEGGWHGNDTVWRMCLDLNRILLYGRLDGTLSDTPLRKIYSITDALIAGEADGPLAPSPRNLGVVTFASSSAFADLVHTALMYFDPDKIPLVSESFKQFRYPLVTMLPNECRIGYRGKLFSLAESQTIFGQTFMPAPGWRKHIEF